MIQVRNSGVKKCYKKSKLKINYFTSDHIKKYETYRYSKY